MIKKEEIFKSMSNYVYKKRLTDQDYFCAKREI